MPPPSAPTASAATAPAANPPAAAPAALAIDERFAALAAHLMSQVDAKLETFRQEIATQLGLSVEPLHKDLHDLLDQQMQAAAKIEALEAANFCTGRLNRWATRSRKSLRRRWDRSFSRQSTSSIRRSRIASRRSRANSASSDHTSL